MSTYFIWILLFWPLHCSYLLQNDDFAPEHKIWELIIELFRELFLVWSVLRVISQNVLFLCQNNLTILYFYFFFLNLIPLPKFVFLGNFLGFLITILSWKRVIHYSFTIKKKIKLRRVVYIVFMCFFPS